MTKIQLKRSSALLSGSARVPAANQLDYGELAVNYSSTDPQLFFKDSGGNVVSFFEPYAPLSGATFTGDCTFNTDVDFDGAVPIQGDSTNGSGKLTLTCEQNTHAVNIKAPAHSASANYTLTLPSSTGNSGEVLSTDGSGGLSWAYAAMSTADKTKLDGIAAGAEVNVNADWNATSGDAEILNKPTVPTNNNQLTNGAGYITDITTQTDPKYLRSDTSDSTTGTLTIRTNTYQLGFERPDSTGSDWRFYQWSSGLNIYPSASASDVFFGRDGSTANVDLWNGSLKVAGTTVLNNSRQLSNVTFGGNTIWHAGNDGSGSGLDADTLDGYQASHFTSNTHTGHSATNLAVGWYTIATNSGSRAVARFGVRDTASGDHQSAVFYASHHYGNRSDITVLHTSYYSGNPFRYIRIREGGTYDGAMLQVYIDDASNNLVAYLLGDNFQSSGWKLKDWVADGTNPGDLGNHGALTNTAAQIDLNQFIDGGMATTGQIYCGGDTTQYKVWHSGNDGAGSGLDADNLDGLTWSSSGKDVRATEFYADNWFRNYNDGEGLYNQATGVHWHADGDGYWTARDSSSHIGIKLKTNGSSLRGYVYANSSNQVGFLDSDGHWAIRHTRDSRTEFFVNNTEYAEINSDYLTHTSDIRTPLFYDSNNTNYYLDPASTSYLNYLGRKAHHTGHLVGSYNSVGANSYKSNPIYTIGSSYNPNDASLNNMYGIGYSHTNASFFGLSGQSGWGMYVAADGDARVQLNGSNGAVSCTGNITAYASDQRLKTNIKPIDKALNKLMKISGVEYDWIDECESEYEFQPRQKHEIGVIAQEVQEVLPELVFEAPFNSLYKAKTGWKQIQKRLQDEEDQAASVEGREATEITKAVAKEAFEKLPLDERVSICTDHQFLTVDYERLAPVLIEAIKELKQQVDSLANLYSK